LKAAGQSKKNNQVICGFSMETSNLIENSAEKLKSKNCDMIVANNLNDKGAGFGIDTNKVTLITSDDMVSLDVLSKKEVAVKILDKAVEIYKIKNGE
ncbi:MAG: phosphopantothenoylcysteine decarboxylase, partial [Eubacterium sp.]|nr:phosphopantothenoylcysteine decarboxylase [Eubacterium sp.]